MSLHHTRKPVRDVRCHPSTKSSVEQVFAEQIIDGVDVVVDPDFDLSAHPQGFLFVDKGRQ